MTRPRPAQVELTGEFSSTIIDSINADPSSVQERARVHPALGEPARLAIVDRLELGDASPSEIGRELGLPSNLLAHHLNYWSWPGVLERSRSEDDHRRTYLRLCPQVLAGLLPVGLCIAPRVVFACTHNLPQPCGRRTAPCRRPRRAHIRRCVHPRAATVAHSCGVSLAHAHAPMSTMFARLYGLYRRGADLRRVSRRPGRRRVHRPSDHPYPRSGGRHASAIIRAINQSALNKGLGSTGRRCSQSTGRR